MPHKVIMPALGMAQDTGRIVSWIKAPGDKLEEGEPLFEVETDKSVVEMPAPASGYLSAVTARVDEDVAVGSVIAMIVDTADEVELTAAVTVEEPQDSEAPPEVEALPDEPRESTSAPAAPKAEPATAPVLQPAFTAPAVSDSTARVLASPKARRMAAERGIDLAALRAQGIPEPIHADDLVISASGGSLSVLTARCDPTALDALLAKGAADTDHTRLFAAFAAGAWQAVFDAEKPGISIQRPDGSVEAPAQDGAGLRLVDLTTTRLSGYVPAVGSLTVTVARDADALVLTFVFPETTLPFAGAVALLDEIAARIEDPIRQLV